MVAVGDLDNRAYDPGGAAGAVPNGFQNPQNVLNAIRDRGDIGDKPAARTAFLQAIHKEIAIRKITAYLAAGVAVNANDLPDRTATAPGALAQDNVDNYRNYIAFIRNAAYDLGQINAFVGEITARKAEGAV